MNSTSIPLNMTTKINNMQTIKKQTQKEDSIKYPPRFGWRGKAMRPHQVYQLDGCC